ncbi:hypothetical protein TWF481_012229 [Arthrobotrys musiformis]|uniref:Uncharacterized protein n=1 Tax=Arthrobotrys musiformis TaxID=47236 RepID=A0AAV9VXW9_9PEZI
MPPKRSSSAALKPRASRSKVSKPTPPSTPRKSPRAYTPRKTKSRSVPAINTTPSRTPSAKSDDRPIPTRATRQKKKVSTKGTSISPINDTPSPPDTPTPDRGRRNTSIATITKEEEVTGFYGLGFVRSVTQQARDFFSGWGYPFGKAKVEKRRPGRKKGARRK